ncbi:MAG TPA: glycosyltransferase [Terriglobales bacterium]|nr:glycosyltransferase [Terriglobales bacterium]
MSNDKRRQVYLHVWTGGANEATELVKTRYPGCEIVLLGHQELRANGWKAQVRALRRLKGVALVLFFKHADENKHRELLAWLSLAHRCRETAVCYSDGKWEVLRRSTCLHRLPMFAWRVARDSAVFARSWLILQFLQRAVRPMELQQGRNSTSLDVAYLFPFPLNRHLAGGAISHVRGVLGGIGELGATCEIYSGSPLPLDDAQHVQVIPAKGKFLFAEALALVYNWQFARTVARKLKKSPASVLYQRHGKFVIAGVLLSRYTGIPLMLEYNGSEYRMSRYWDPSRFHTWLRLTENVALRGAAKVVVVSEALRQELLDRGVSRERILMNPNGVDPTQFRPGCGGAEVRTRLGFSNQDVVVGFLGTFSYWHGIAVLQQAVQRLLSGGANRNLKFLFIGEGPLQPEMQSALAAYVGNGQVVFTGLLPHDRVRAHLDAADVLVSPHVPIPDGQPFFGSPTKLFEYMAMAKAIVASDLEQIARVLSHMQTAVLVPPADPGALAVAIEAVAADQALRERLGRNARNAAIERHTWRHNAQRVLACVKGSTEEFPEFEHAVTRTV